MILFLCGSGDEIKYSFVDAQNNTTNRHFKVVLLPSNKHNDFPYSAHSGVVGPKPDLGSQMWLGSDQLHSES